MKRYAVFAKKLENRKDEQYVIWHFLNDTDDIEEAFTWHHAAMNNKDYGECQIVERIYLEVTKI